MRNKDVYRWIEGVTNVPLGLADKMWINRIIAKWGLNTIDDIGRSIRIHLSDAGYKSQHLKDTLVEMQQFDHDFTNYVLERYGYPRIDCT